MAYLQLVLSSELRGYDPQSSLEQNFSPYEGLPIRLPEKPAEPAAEFLDYHRSEILRG